MHPNLSPRRAFLRSLAILQVGAVTFVGAQQPDVLPGTLPLTMSGDLSAQMVAGIDKFLMREIDQSVSAREKLWHRDFSSREAYEKSVGPNREDFRRYIGAVDPRLPVKALEYVNGTGSPAQVAATDRYRVFAVRWPVFDGVYGEGLLLQPTGDPVARIVAIPDADQTPEMLVGLAAGLPAEAQFARRLAENGCEVIVMTLVNRQDTFSGNPVLNRFTNQPHREWIYRQAFELGRHIIGYEVEKVLAAVDWFARDAGGTKPRIGVAGYAEGGLIALYSAALDPRIDTTLVSGYFDSRQRVWAEPIYRNVFGLLHEFGDAEIASLIAPRTLVIEHSESPKITGPPTPRNGRGGAAPGKWQTPEFDSVDAEVNRAKALCPAKDAFQPKLEFVYGNEGRAVGPCSEQALLALLSGLGRKLDQLKAGGPPPVDARPNFNPDDRQRRQIAELTDFTQNLLHRAEDVRNQFWSKARPKAAADWAAACQWYRDYLWDEVIGRFPKASLPPNPRTRKIHDQPNWTCYEVVLDVWPNVYAWGDLLVPKDLKPGERRPVVVCQHGLEGVPEDTVTDDPKSGGYPYYKAFAARLADQGFITYAPHNPYRGQDKFRVLQRKLNPLKKSLYSVILAQHDRTLDWLSGLPFVDSARIGFYGLSYGGKTAVRVPALLDRYVLSICSADFNEWIKKNVTVDSGYSYMFTGEYELPEFNLGNTFNYAELAALIAPRPFMVERGHHDGVAPDTWVAYEYARVRGTYMDLGIADRTAIEFFNGPHTINGVGTFKFLHQHLNWPER